jgi:pimeloyl-ACP methyl ester carboxylesterase
LILALGAISTAIIAWWIERRYPPAGRFVEVAGGRLHVVERTPRDGPALGTIVLLHGASSNASDPMLGLGERLATQHRVIAIDRPGHGWSNRVGGTEAAKPGRQAAAIAEALRRLDVRDAVVVGHSWAGAVAPNLALDHRDVTGGLVLVAGVTHPWPGGGISWYYHPVTSIFGWLLTRTVTTPAGFLLMEPTLRAVFAPQAPPPDFAEGSGIALVLRPPVFAANAEDVAGLHAAVSEQHPRYSAIRVPAVVIGGAADRIVRTDLHSRSFAREVPGARLVVLDGAGHMPHQTHPDAIAAEIEALVGQVRSASRSASGPP